MRFKLLDVLNGPASQAEFRIQNLVTRRTAQKTFSSVPCNHYCAFKACSVTQQDVTVADCARCSTHDVVSGHIVNDHGEHWDIVDGLPRFALHTVSERNGTLVTHIDFRHDPRWRPFIASQPNALVYHHPAWLEALECEYNQRCLTLAVEDDDGCITGVLPLLYTRGFPFDIGNQQTGRRLTSLPRTPLAGPIARSPAVIEQLTRAAIAQVADQPGLELQIKSPEPLPADLPLQCTKWRPTYVLSLPAPGEQLRFGDAKNRHNLKWAVNKAVKLGLEVRPAESEDELHAWYLLYLDVMRRNLVPPRPYRLFQSLWRQLRAEGHMSLLLVEQTEGSQRRLIAGAVFLMCGETFVYAFTGCMTSDLTKHANDLILWNAIHSAWERGYHYFDFGECPEEHPELVRFKTKWGAVPVPQYRYYYPIPRSSENPAPHGAETDAPSSASLRALATRLWRKVPLSVTERAGDWLYSWL